MLHKEAITPALDNVLKELMRIERLLSFRLVGGTAIALHLGHRISIDIDLFSNESINKQHTAKALNNKFPGIDCFITEDGIMTRIEGVKVDVFDNWMIPFRDAPVIADQIRLASLNDLAAMKLTAFTERREKKDYIDLYFLFQKMGALPLLLEYENYNPMLSAKSLLFALEEVTTAMKNASPMPDMITEVSWKQIAACMHAAAEEYLHFLEGKRKRKSDA
jgi:hypothetical protein